MAGETRDGAFKRDVLEVAVADMGAP